MSNFIHLQLAGDRLLTLNPEKGILSLQRADVIVAQELFTPVEVLVLAQLLACWPDYATSEQLYAAVHQASQTAAHRVVLQATEERRLDITMHQVRNVIARCRVKLATLDLTIEAEVGLGYKLVDKQAGPGCQLTTPRALPVTPSCFR